jgi:hypothetical protein
MAMATAEARKNLKKESQERLKRGYPRAPDRPGMRAYSIGTTSRPISRATSSKRSLS